MNGGAATDIEAAYDRTAGVILGPIAEIVDGVRNIPVFGSLINTISEKVDALSDATIGRAVEAALGATGLDKTIENVAMAGVTKALEFAGAGIKYTPESAGQLNYMLLGASATAESSARLGGAAASTALTLEYSNRLAAEWKAENEASVSTFEKYASLSNPKSFASSALMAIATSSPKESLSDLLNPASNLQNFASAFNSTARAETNINASSVAEWGGVKTYDYPRECIELDPLAPNYFSNATNADDIGVALDKATMTDPERFWNAVYAALPDDEGEEATAESIYNCALLDARVMGGLGYTSGYESDGGLGSAASQTTVDNQTPTLQAGDDIPAQDTSTLACRPHQLLVSWVLSMGIKTGIGTESSYALYMECA